MDVTKSTELVAAARSGDVTLLRALLPEAGDLSPVMVADGITPLMAAAAAGHHAAVALLLERGSDPARRDLNGRSAAAYARDAGHLQIAAQLSALVDNAKLLR